MRSLLITSLVVLVSAAGNNSCKCFPGDQCWPSEPEWDSFNGTVGGRLIETVPLGSPCHDPQYNATLCKTLQSEWFTSPVHIQSSSSVQNAIFTNASCDPFTPSNTPCLLGNFVRYAVNVTGPEDIAATIQFAKKSNIRLVIRNTGHDLLGRSTGAGGLAIWTHYLKSIDFLDWNDADYSGKAIKLGAGVQAFEVVEAASAAGLVVVTGECPTIGVAGGYTQAGGHSALSTAFGLSADNTLEFEVVTADGQFVTANPSSPEYADLFWALSGSGAGNYGIVVSVTLKAHADKITSGGSFSITTPGFDYSAILDTFHGSLPDVVDSGTQVIYSASTGSLVVYSITGYNRTQVDIENALKPFVTAMTSLNITMQLNYTQFNSYYDHYAYYFGPLPVGRFSVADAFLIGGRLLPRALLRSVGPAINATLQLGVEYMGMAMNVSRFDNPARIAVLPQWRDAVVSSTYALPYSFTLPFSDMLARQNSITNTIMPLIEQVTPGAGAYINEADFQQLDWQNVFFGSNYKKLMAIKEKYDPQGLLYNSIAVGSERWEVRDDGRMCSKA